MKRFPANIPRNLYWSRDIGGTVNCPACGGALVNENHVYLLALRRGKAIESFVIGCNGGHFCEGCLSVVLDSEAFDRLAELAAKGREGAEYIVLGLVDIEATPASQSTKPMGSNENPIHLVSFTNLAVVEKDQDHPIGRKQLKRGTAKRKRRRKETDNGAVLALLQDLRISVCGIFKNLEQEIPENTERRIPYSDK